METRVLSPTFLQDYNLDGGAILTAALSIRSLGAFAVARSGESWKVFDIEDPLLQEQENIDLICVDSERLQEGMTHASWFNEYYVVPRSRPRVAVFPIDAAMFGGLMSLVGKFGGARSDTFHHNLRETNSGVSASSAIPDDFYFRGDLARFEEAVVAFFDWSEACNRSARERALAS